MSLIGVQSRRILSLSRLLVNCRHSSNSSNSNGDQNDKLADVLKDLKNHEKLHKKPPKPLELKAKPSKKKIETSSSSSDSSSSSSDEEVAVSQELTSAAKSMADSMAKSVKGTEDEKQAIKDKTETDLMRTLAKLSKDTANAKAKSQVDNEPLFDFSQFKVQKSKPENTFVKGLKSTEGQAQKSTEFKARQKPELTKEQKEFLEKRRKMRREAQAKAIMDEYQPTNLFEASKSLAIFSQLPAEAKSVGSLNAWATFEERELRIWQTQPPRNLLEDMAQMTDKGIMWHFPIDNEQGLDENEVTCFVSALYQFSQSQF